MRLHTRREALYATGIEHVAVFGSTVRGEACPESDLDLAVRLRTDVRLGWDYSTLDDRIAALLGVAVDLARTDVPAAVAEIEIALALNSDDN